MADVSARANGVVDERPHVGHRTPGDHRADLGTGVRSANGQLLHPDSESLGELLDDRGVDVEPIRRGAGLAAVAELGGHGAVDGSVEIGVGRDDERRVATQLHRTVDDAFGGLAQQQSTDTGGAGERDLADPAVIEPRADHGGGIGGGDDVDDAVGNSRLGQQLCDGNGGHRRLGGGFEHHGAAGCQCGGDLAGGHGRREVPRGDQRGHTDGAVRHHGAGTARRVAP